MLRQDRDATVYAARSGWRSNQCSTTCRILGSTIFSPSSKRAANEGRFQNRTSTHTGRIYMKPINGKSVPFIIHNINGNVIAEPYGNLSNRITRISRPVESPSNKSHLRYDLPNNRYMRVYEDGREKPVNENELR